MGGGRFAPGASAGWKHTLAEEAVSTPEARPDRAAASAGSLPPPRAAAFLARPAARSALADSLEQRGRRAESEVAALAVAKSNGGSTPREGGGV